jgi:hypothetical protein
MCTGVLRNRQGGKSGRKPTGFIWVLSAVNKICDQFFNGGDIVAIWNGVLLHWIDVAVYWRGF